MSRALLAVAGLLLAATGFALGRFSASVGAEGNPPGGSGGSIADALADPEPYRRAARLAILLSSLGPEALPEVRETFDAAPAFQFGPTALELLMRFWATHEPEAATTWAFSSGPPSCSVAAIQPAVELWARSDPLAVTRFIRSSGLGGDSVEIAEVALVRGWFRSGVPGLEDYIRDLGLSPERQRALATLAKERIQRDGSDAAQRWAEGLPDADQKVKLEAFTQMAGELAKVDPAAAAAWCKAHCGEPYGVNIATEIATHWGARDGLAAMRWLSTLPAGQERDMAVGSAFFAWRHYDSQGLSTWLEEMKVEDVEPWFRPAAGRYAVMLAHTHPAKALEWAALVEDDQERELVLLTVARRWLRNDERAAEAWLEQSPLSEEARARARNLEPRTTAPRRRAESPPDPPS